MARLKGRFFYMVKKRKILLVCGVLLFHFTLSAAPGLLKIDWRGYGFLHRSAIMFTATNGPRSISFYNIDSLRYSLAKKYGAIIDLSIGQMEIAGIDCFPFSPSDEKSKLRENYLRTASMKTNGIPLSHQNSYFYDIRRERDERIDATNEALLIRTHPNW
jgi:hypothetical protein